MMARVRYHGRTGHWLQCVASAALLLLACAVHGADSLVVVDTLSVAVPNTDAGRFTLKRAAGTGRGAAAPIAQLKLDNVEIGLFLAKFSESCQISIVVNEAVQGRVSGYLYDVRVVDALRAVVLSSGFDLYKHQNVYVVVPRTEQQPLSAAAYAQASPVVSATLSGALGSVSEQTPPQWQSGTQPQYPSSASSGIAEMPASWFDQPPIVNGARDSIIVIDSEQPAAGVDGEQEETLPSIVIDMSQPGWEEKLRAFNEQLGGSAKDASVNVKQGGGM